MSQVYVTRQRKLAEQMPSASRTVPATLEHSTAPYQSVSEGGADSYLAEQMQARIQQHFLSHQIPQAEEEADRLSAGLGDARTPEEVKTRLGERMGADFSGIRFHTDSGAAAAADDIGARAYTAGNDIYFGAGGFDPAVAAHELVHTAQQGLVESGTSTVSTPAGEVQMMPAFLKKAQQGISNALGNIKTGAKNAWNDVQSGAAWDNIKTGALAAVSKVNQGEDWLWRKTGGKLQRDHHDAMDELDQAMKDGTWDSLSEKQKRAWKFRNPLAYAHYMTDFGGSKKETDERIRKREQEVDQAKKFLKERKLGHSSAIRDPEVPTPPSNAPAQASAPAPVGDPAQEIAIANEKGVNRTAPKMSFGSFVDGTADMTGMSYDYAGDLIGIAKDSLGKGLAQNITGGISSSLGMLNDVAGGVQAGKEAVEAFKQGDKGEGWDAVARATSSGTSFMSNANTLATAFGNGSEVFGGATAAITGTIDAARGARDARRGFKQRSAMNRFIETDAAIKGKAREDLTGDDLLYRDMATMGKMQGTKKAVEGTSRAITGALDATGGVLGATGVGAVGGAVLHGVSTGIKMGTKVYSAYQDDKMKKTIVEQTTGITNDVIRDFMAESGITNFSRAKQALMKALGYESGKREELRADQTAKRSAKLVEDAKGGSARAQTLVSGMGVDEIGAGDSEDKLHQAEDKLFKAMGGTESRDEIVNRKFSLKAMKKDNERAQSAQNVQGTPPAQPDSSAQPNPSPQPDSTTQSNPSPQPDLSTQSNPPPQEVQPALAAQQPVGKWEKFKNFFKRKP